MNLAIQVEWNGAGSQDQFWMAHTFILIGSLCDNNFLEELMCCQCLEDIRVFLNERIGTDIQKGDALESVYHKVHAALI